MAENITINDLTTGTVDGTGVFDKLMQAVNVHIEDQYTKGRLKGPDYASVYLGALQSTISQSIQFLLQEEKVQAEVALMETQKAEAELNGAKDRELKDAQKLLYDRQREGFDDNKNQKLFEAQMNAWALMFSSGLLTEKPAIITSDEVTSLYNEMRGTGA